MFEHIQGLRQLVFDSGDYAEGIRAFWEKRPAVFRPVNRQLKDVAGGRTIWYWSSTGWISARSRSRRSLWLTNPSLPQRLVFRCPADVGQQGIPVEVAPVGEADVDGLPHEFHRFIGLAAQRKTLGHQQRQVVIEPGDPAEALARVKQGPVPRRPG